jgi:hypothetical protein
MQVTTPKQWLTGWFASIQTKNGFPVDLNQGNPGTLMGGPLVVEIRLTGTSMNS